MDWTAQTPEETAEIGRRIGSHLRAGDVVALEGPLGAGKTVLVGGIARGLQIDPGYSVTSPTFVFAHIYDGKVPLYHIDLYRVEKESELAGIGLGEMLGGDGVAVVEWFERFPKLWPGDRLNVRIGFGERSSRAISVGGDGVRGNSLERSIAEDR
ncbi:MAG: tRNA (adenosine(37)-N6)-threonylcarbamoyltransferase complex ATPase subunit type 1 TsaE [Pseudomonadota bacterium]